MKKGFRLGIAVFCCAWLAGCLALPANVAAELDAARPGETNPYATRVPSNAIANATESARRTRRGVSLQDLPLASGQIVVMDDGDATGLFVSLFAEEYLPWSHVGIVVIEADGPVIYDTNGGFFPVPGLPPTATFSGGMRRIPFIEYFSRQKIIGVYSLPPEVDAGKIVAYVREQYARGTPFDPFFNNDDASALYCAELVALAKQAAGAALIRQTPVRGNRSYAVLREWLQIRTNGLYLPGQLADPMRQVALWSADLTPTQITAYFEIRRELTRRFDSRARLGHLFQWTGKTLVLRDKPQRFVDATLTTFATYTGNTDSVRKEVQRLANLYFSNDLPAGNSASPVSR